MSTKTKKTSKTNENVFVRDLPNGKKVKLPNSLDLEQMFTLVDAVKSIDDDADQWETLAALRAIMPDGFLAQVKGVDVGVALNIFMEWVSDMGETLGKALTTQPASNTPAHSLQTG